MGTDINKALYGTNLFGEAIKPKASGPVAERFGFPPFSVLNARAGEWQDRKRAWINIGIKSELGRSANDAVGDLFSTMNDYDGGGNRKESTTSIFDPVLCECIYRWFTKENDQIVDPFAGGSVRGIVAGMLKRNYWGCDLQIEQIEANNIQADKIQPNIRPFWHCGDALEQIEFAPSADFIFSCPPYGNLEVYSDDYRDLSNMSWEKFIVTYRKIIRLSVKRLKPNRFACFVVGDFRNKKGYYQNFVSETIKAFVDAGIFLYNEAILTTSVGSACMRVTKQFAAGRKFAKTHQNILLFCKGDWHKAASRLKDLSNG